MFSGKNAYKHLQVLAGDIGPRHGGSRDEARAARYIRDYWKSIGLSAKLQAYPIYSFESAEASLAAQRGKKIPCAPFPMTASTPPRGITRETIFLEGCEAAYLDERIRDKIVVTFGTFHGELLERFLSLAPAGLVSVQPHAYQAHVGRPVGFAAKRKIGSIPSLCLTLDEGLKLIKNLPKKLTMKVVTREEKLGKGYNVVADLKGSDPQAETVVVCAHYDSVWIGPGAFDNGGGAASIMELARVYAEKGSRYPLRFIAFGGEEMGLWGSKAYVKKLKEDDEKLKKDKDFERDGLKSELDRIRFIVNLDMLGHFYGVSKAVILGDPDIAASLRLHGNEQRYAITITEDSVYSSDNAPFNLAGVPSASFHRSGYGDGGGHTANDVVEKCSAEGLEHIVSFVESWIDRYIQEMHTFPFARALPAEAKKTVKTWFKDKDCTDFEVFGVKKQYSQPKGRAKRKR